jgi:putative salt-induced outer membrane protein
MPRPLLTVLSRGALMALSVCCALHSQPLQAQEPARNRPVEFSVNAGFAQTSGNANATTTNFGNKFRATARGWSLSQDLAFFYGEANDRVNANFWNGGLRTERRLVERLRVFVASRFDRNVLQGIASRFEEGFGLDARFIDAPRDRLAIQLGGSFFQQRLTPGSTAAIRRTFPAARAGLEYRHAFSQAAYVQQNAEYLPNLAEGRSYLVNTETSLVAPLSKRLAVKLGYVVRYNSTPPSREEMVLRNTDTFFSSGLTFTY